MDDNFEFLNAARVAVQKAGEVIMEIYGTDFSVEQKEDKSPVTEADLAANTVLTEGLAQFGYPVLSEETVDNKERLEHETVWIVDPLDGTNDFIEETGEFSIMVGLAHKGVPIFGVVYLPAIDKMYVAQKGKGALVKENGEERTLSVTDTRDPQTAKAVSSRSHMTEQTREILNALNISDVVGVGSNGVKIGIIAEGKADVFINPTSKMGEWDMCAPQIILEEAGGMLTDMEGNVHSYNKEIPSIPHGVVASNGALHDALITHTKKRSA